MVCVGDVWLCGCVVVWICGGVDVWWCGRVGGVSTGDVWWCVGVL